MVGRRLLLVAGLALAGGCGPADPPSPAPEEVAVEEPQVKGPDNVSGLAVTIAGETLRLDAEAVRGVRREVDPYLGAPVLVVLLDDRAADRFADLTGAHIGKRAVVTLDGRVLAAPTVQARIAAGRVTLPLPNDAADDLETRVREATGT